MASPFTNTLTVWHALFLRESLDRFFSSRAAWFWLILEPSIHILLIGWLFSIRNSSMGLPANVNIVIWLAIGMIAFFMFRRTAIQVLHSVDCNKAFFAFRQVRPFDAALARGSVEAFAMFFVAIVIVLPLGFFDMHFIPVDPLLLLGALLGLWLLGMGYGLITSVLQRLVPELGHIFGLLMLPLYFASGVIIPVSVIPAKYLHYILWNPIFHGIELARAAHFPNYPLIAGTSLGFLFLFDLVLWLVGLCLFKLFETRLLTR